MYIAEVVPPAMRGRLVSLNTLMIVVGQLAAYLVNSALATTGIWEWMLGLAAIPGTMIFVGMLCVPDSPVCLVSRRRVHQAQKVTAQLRIRFAKVTPPESNPGASI